MYEVINISYPENEDSLKSIAVSASVQIHNAQTKGVQHDTVIMSSP